MPATMPPNSNKEIAGGGAVDRTPNHDAVFFEGNQRSPEWYASHETPCAIDRIDDPPTWARLRLLSHFLAEDGVCREALFDPASNRRLRVSICLRDLGAVRLDLNSNSLPEMAEGDVSAEPSHLFQSSQQIRSMHVQVDDRMASLRILVVSF